MLTLTNDQYNADIANDQYNTNNTINILENGYKTAIKRL
jgi:hypothetical protein